MCESIVGCLSCDTVSGRFQPPGGIVYNGEHWIVALRKNPVRQPCLPFIILKRHCEDMAELNDEEAATLGPLLRRFSQVLQESVAAEKVYFGLYGEQVKHIHLHVFPRLPHMPASNKLNRRIDRWYERLHGWGLRRAYDEETVAAIAEHLRAAFQKTST